MPSGFYLRTKEHKRKMSEGQGCGKYNSHWKGGITLAHHGYRYIYSVNHPNKTNDKYVMEHRLVYEAYLNKVSYEMWLRIIDEKIYPADAKFLKRNEVIHHKNGIVDDNRIGNLALIIGRGIHNGKIKCPFCYKQFQIR